MFDYERKRKKLNYGQNKMEKFIDRYLSAIILAGVLIGILIAWIILTIKERKLEKDAESLSKMIRDDDDYNKRE